MPVEFLKYTPGRTMRVRVTAPTRVRGQHFDEGTVVELAHEDAFDLMVAGKAVKVVEAPAAPAKPGK